METKDAVKRLSALAQDARIEVFRLLVKAGPEGLPAGEISRRLGAAANTTSAQLLILSNAGLVRARRNGRSIIYSVEFEKVSDLLVYLMEDCCGGRAEVRVQLTEKAGRCRNREQEKRSETVSRSHSRR